MREYLTALTIWQISCFIVNRNFSIAISNRQFRVAHNLIPLSVRRDDAGFTAMGYTDSIPTGIIVLGCSWMVLTGLHKVGGWHELIARVSQAVHIARP